ncbi:hypothetical protein [Alkalihalobacterium alkalinitrilicum]|nr:hypothetical protein [Alkalihalobacterium alkalinitrilicum]
MDHQCFYCNSELEENSIQYASFIQESDHIEQPLCKECYKEWLAGIKE